MGPCNRTREELDARLREAGYGKDADMFACFFRRSTAEEAAEASKAAGCGAILCLSCGHSIGDHGGGGTVVGATVADERPAEGAVAVTAAAPADGGGGEGDDRAALLGGIKDSTAADDEGADEECTPPMLPPGMVSKHAYDEVFFDNSGLLWKVTLVLSIAGGFYAYHLMRGFWTDGSTGIAGYIMGVFLACGCLATFVITIIPPTPIADMYHVRVAHLADRDPSTTAAYNGRALWQENLQQRFCCGGDPDFSKHFKARDVKSVQLDYNAASPGSTARIWLNMKPGQSAQHVGGLAVAVTTTTTTAQGPSLVVFRGKCVDPRARAAAWREYLKPNAPQALLHVEGLNPST